MGKILISVILPCYNVENLVDRCLQSIVVQTIGIENIEIICVDDCSTDGTVSRLEAWEKLYPENFIIVKSPINERQGQARNIGLEYSSADWVTFIDSDDWIDPDYLKSMYEAGRKSDCEIVCCGSRRDFSKELTCFNDENTDVKLISIRNDNDRKSQIMHPELGYFAYAKIIRKDFLINNDLVFQKNLTYEDVPWGLLLHLYFNKAYVLKKTMYHYFVNDSSTILTKNSNHHLDCLTTQSRLWQELKDRGFLDKYRYEIEVEHIYSAYLVGMKMLILRYDTPDYNVYLLLRELIRERIPDIRQNIYYQNGEFKEIYMLMLDALINQLNRSQFLEFAEAVKKIGI